LNDIQTTSENLATLILAIAKETQNQSKSAESIVGSMRVIQDISAQTLEGTTESARAVGELSEQADELRQSIADFKLPDAMQPESIVNSVDDDLPAGVDEMSFVDVEEDSESGNGNSGILDDEMILGEEDDETTSFEADSHESSDDDADLDVDFIDDFDTGTDDNELAANADIETADESLDEVDFTEFDDEQDETEATVSLDVGSEAEAADSDVSSGENETAEADDFEATMIMEAPDLQSEEETDDSEKPEEKKTDKDPEQDDEDEMDFSFDDEDFLSFDIDEEEKK
jgi:hypothetical protein